MPRKSSYREIKPGEWHIIPMRNHREQCCDCGLVHRTTYHIFEDSRGRLRIEMKAYRDGNATGGARRTKR